MENMDGNYQRKKASEAAWSEEGLRSSKLQRGKNGLQKSIRRLLCSTIHARKWRNLGSILCRGCSLRDNFFIDARGKGEFSSLRERLDKTRISLRKRNSRLRLTLWKIFYSNPNCRNVHLKIFAISMKRAWPTNYLPRVSFWILEGIKQVSSKKEEAFIVTVVRILDK